MNQSMPLVTFVVPCYNSALYMSRAVDSLLEVNHPCEVLLINDGSSDDTGKIARAYAEKYDFVQAIDQENANWGGVVNNGLSRARGRFFKVLDSDDYLEPEALHRVLDALAECVEAGATPDLLITNYIYDHLPSGTQRVQSYANFMPEGRVFTWDEMGKPKIDEFIMVHATWYATSVLRQSGVLLPESMSYMDSLLLLHPMPYVEKLYYLNVEPYWYAIGREGQSMDIEVIRARLHEQLFATMLVIQDADYSELYEKKPNCAELMAGYLICMMSVSTLNLFSIGTPDAIAQNKELWGYMKECNPRLHKRLRRSFTGAANRKTPLGRFIAVKAFDFFKKRYKLE